MVREYLHAADWAQPPEDVDEIITAGGWVTWHWGYRNLIMTEYHLLTGNEFVLPAIRQLSRTPGRGPGCRGPVGHRMVHPELGRAYGYGVMNQPSLSIFISLILAEKCGVQDAMVREAIARTHGHFDKLQASCSLFGGPLSANGRRGGEGFRRRDVRAWEVAYE